MLDPNIADEVPKPPNISITDKSSHEVALGINPIAKPTKEFIPTQIGVIYEENSLIGSIQDDSVFFDRGMTIFEYEPLEYQLDVISNNALTLSPRKRPLSTSIAINRTTSLQRCTRSIKAGVFECIFIEFDKERRISKVFI
jgi:hypothetical protein